MRRSPQKIAAVARHRFQQPSPSPPPNRSTTTTKAIATAWKPGDPIAFAPPRPLSRTNNSREVNRPWKAGDPIMFEAGDIGGGGGDLIQPVPRRSDQGVGTSELDTGDALSQSSSSSTQPYSARATRAHSTSQLSFVSSSSGSWSNYQRILPPSPSTSNLSYQSGSTALFSFAGDYAQIPPLQPDQESETLLDPDISIGSLGAVDEWGYGKVSIGIQCGSPQLVRELKAGRKGKPTKEELDALTAGIEFGDDDLGGSDVENGKYLPLLSAKISQGSTSTSPGASGSNLKIIRRPSPPSPLSTEGRIGLFSPCLISTSQTSPSSLAQLNSTTLPSARQYSTRHRRKWETAISDQDTSSSYDDGTFSSEELRSILHHDRAATYLESRKEGLERRRADHDFVDIEGDNSQLDRLEEMEVGGTLPPDLRSNVFKREGLDRSKMVAARKRREVLSPVLNRDTPKVSNTTGYKPSIEPPTANIRSSRPPSYGSTEKVQRVQNEENRLKATYQEFRYDQGPGLRPHLIYTSKEDVVERALKDMKGPLGFDLEWPPSFKRGTENKTALVQVCDEKTILLAHVSQMKSFPTALKELIEDPSRIKLGVQIAGDASKLRRDFSFTPRGIVELSSVARRVDAPRWAGRTYSLIGLQTLCATYLERYLPKEKNIRMGRWDRELDERQKYYAANDVYSSLQIFLQLQSQADPEYDIIGLVDQKLPFFVRPQQSVVPPSTSSSTRPPAAPRVGPGPFDQILSTSIPYDGEVQPKLGPPTARQLEAYDLYHTQGLPLNVAAEKMSSETKAIKSITVVWNTISCLQRDPSLPFDAQKLWDSMGKVGLRTHKYFMAEESTKMWVKELKKKLK
ncbi:hypothetical protein T439DRAFT_350375 [Meredithblackwellia eburnea MCA 4105]